MNGNLNHDSLKISNGKWCWHSRSIGGKNALKYLIEVKNIPFTEAVEIITGQAAVMPSVSRSPAVSPPKPKVLLLPKVNRTATAGFNYLRSRGIDAELIHHCIRTGRFYESYPHHSAVFVGLDKENKPRYATIRGIGNDFIGEANGSDKRYSFSFPAEHSDTLCLFESAVDLLSFATLLKFYRVTTKPFKVRQWAAILFTAHPLTGLTHVCGWSDIWRLKKAARTVGRLSVAI